MKHLRKALALLLSVAMLLSLVVVSHASDHDCPSKDFIDAPAEGNWAHEGVDYMIANGIMNGTSDSPKTFSPKIPTNRAMIVQILYRLEGEPEVTGDMPFKDVATGRWYYKAILWAIQNGVTKGVTETQFNPNGNVTREQIAAFIYRFENPADSPDPAVLAGFPDAKAVSTYAVEPMSWAVGKGIINGKGHDGESYLDPKANANRDEVATMIYRYLSLVHIPCEHDYVAVVTPPSCITPGYTTYTCSKCGDTYTADRVDLVDHDYQAEVTPPTCTEQGYTTYTCSMCGQNHSVYDTEALGHDWDEGKITTAPTPDAPGERTFTCRRCGETKTEPEPYVETSLPESVDFTKAEDADKYEIKGPVSARQTNDGLTLVTTRNAVEPCNGQNSGAQASTPEDLVEVPVSGDWIATLTFDFSTGSAANGYYQFFGFFAAQGDDYQNMAGIRCGNNDLQDFLRVDGAVTADTDGVKSAPGVNAAGTYYLRIRKLGDSYNCYRSDDGSNFTEMFSYDNTGIEADKIVIDAYTGMTAGYTYTVESLRFMEPDHKHSYESKVTEPTCTAEGYTTYTCATCGHSYQGDTVPALGHNYVDGVCTRCGKAEPNIPENLNWVSTWATAEENFTASSDRVPNPLNGTTVRQIIRVTTSGSVMKLKFSNEFGNTDVVVHSLHVAKQVQADKSTIDPATDTVVTVGESEEFVIPKGKTIETDPFEFEVQALENIAVSMYFGNAPTTAATITGHRGARATTYQVSGNKVADETINPSKTILSWYFLCEASLDMPEGSRAVVCFGDSITDGYGTDADYLGKKPDSYTRWGDYFAKRLQADENTKNVAVLNEGIGANSMFGGSGPAGKDRYARDLLDHNGVEYVIILFGVNDLNKLNNTGMYDRLKTEFQKMIQLAHENGIKVYLAPILPFGTSDYYSTASEQVRTMLNDWFRSEDSQADGIIDFESAVADPNNPKNILEKYTHSDGLHPYDGYDVMADAIDLKLFY